MYDDPLLADVPDHKPIDTGLLDRRGNKILRHPNPVGFHRPQPKPRKAGDITGKTER